MMDFYKKIKDEVLKRSKGDHTVVKIWKTLADNTRFGEARTTQNMSKEEVLLVVEVHRGRKTGSYTTTLNEGTDIEAIVERADEIAKNSVEDPEYMPPLEKQDVEPRSLFDNETINYSPTEKAGVLNEIFSHARESKVKVAGLFTTGYRNLYLANSLGHEAYYEQTFAELSMTVMGEDSTGYAAQSGLKVSEIDPQDIYNTALHKCLMGKNPKDIEPGEYKVVLEPIALGDLLPFMVFDLEARFADAGISYFSGKLGERIFSENVTILTDPYDKRNPSIHFSIGDGLKLRKIYWVKNGVLENLEYDRYWAKEKNAEPTGMAYPLLFEDKDKSVQDLIKEVDKGILVTRFWYIRHVDRRTLTLTGMTRDGTFYIENGEIKYPVKNMRFNESLARVLAGVMDVGRGRKVPGFMNMSVYVPPVVVEKFNFASKSEAK